MISVAIIDTHNPLMLESLAALLAGKDEISVTGQFSSITDFMKKMALLKPNNQKKNLNMKTIQIFKYKILRNLWKNLYQ